MAESSGRRVDLNDIVDLPGSVPTHRGAEETRQHRDRCTLDTAVNTSFETETDLASKKLSVGCGGCERVKVHINLMPPHPTHPTEHHTSISWIIANSKGVPSSFQASQSQPLLVLCICLYIFIFCLLYIHIYVTSTYVLFKMVFRHP